MTQLDTDNACTDSCDVSSLLGQIAGSRIGAEDRGEGIAQACRAWNSGTFLRYLIGEARRASRLSSQIRSDECRAPTEPGCVDTV